MLSPSVATTAVDLSRLPAPDMIQSLSYQQIFNEMLAKLVQIDPDGFTALTPTDPAWRILEVCAWFRMLDRQQLNDDARQSMVAFAKGGNLDHRGLLVNVERLTLSPADPSTGAAAVMEDDEAYRRRIILGPDGFSVAGPEAAYVFHALSADPDVLDASAFSPIPGHMHVAVQSRLGEGEASPELLAAVTARLTDRAVRPQTDFVTVMSAEVVHYTSDARLWLFAGPDANVVLAEAATRRDAYFEECRRLGRDVTTSGQIAAMFVPGVQRVELLEPTADVTVTKAQVAVCTARNLVVAGVAE